MFAILLNKGMDPFYQNISAFPTVFFTFFLLLTVLYWLVAVLGFIDIDFLDFDIPDADGALDVNTDHNFSTPDALAGLMMRMGLNGIPVTIIVSFIALFGWLISYFVVYFLFGLIPDGLLHYLAGIPVLLGSLYIAAGITALVIKPLRPLFKKPEQTEKRIIGQTAKVRSSRVDEQFGEAVLEDGGAGLILKVRADVGKTFVKGDKVVILEKLEQDIYLVISQAEFH